MTIRVRISVASRTAIPTTAAPTGPASKLPEPRALAPARSRRAEGRLSKALLASVWNGLLLLSLLLPVLPGVARAQAPDPLRILVLAGPTPEWLRRVRGQLSDLPVSIATLALAVEGQPEPELARQLGPLAEHRDAVLVAWLITDQGARRAVAGDAVSVVSTRVGIWFARSGRFFSRPLGGAWTRLSASDRSGVLELAALSVRSAVRSLLLDPLQPEPFRDLEPARPAPSTATPNAATTSGAAPPSTAPPTAATAATPSAVTPEASSSTATATANAEAATRAAAAEQSATEHSAAEQSATEQSGVGVGSAPPDAIPPQDGPIVTSPGAAEVATDPASSASAAASGLALDLHWSVELGAVGQIPGPPAYGALGLEAGVRAQRGAWGALLLGQLGMPLRSKLGPTQIEVLQHALLAEGQYLRWNTGPWSFGPLARAGVRWARRETVESDPGLDASAVKWHRALRLGLGWTTELRWGTRFGATLRGVLHWDPARPSYAVFTTEGDPVSRAEPWAVQPSLEIGGNWYW
ncbi:MAG: hypothetical protein ABI895_03955 [Deltaproteobacteria bacterium]